MSDETRPKSNNQSGARRAVTVICVFAAIFSVACLFEDLPERAMQMQLAVIGLGVNLIAARYYWRG